MIQIPGLLGIYFDAVVVEVKTFFTFIQIDSGHTVREKLTRHNIHVDICIRVANVVAHHDKLLTQ